MTTPLAQAAIASFVALSTEDTLHQLTPGLERLYNKPNPTPCAPERSHETLSEADIPKNSATKVQEWISHSEPAAAKDNGQQAAKTSKAKAEERVEQSATSKEVEKHTKVFSSLSKEMIQESSMGDKPKEWKASLTIADIKAGKEDEGRKKNDAVHPHRGE